MIPENRITLYCLLLLIAFLGWGCNSDRTLLQPDPIVSSYEVSGAWPVGLSHFLEAIPAQSLWTWRPLGRDTGEPPRMAFLRCESTGYSWSLADGLMVALCLADSGLILDPIESELWHGMSLSANESIDPWLPLPRIPLDSPHYLDMLHLMSDLAPERFKKEIRHWQIRPIPVDTGNARSGEVDLSAELFRAQNIWNKDYGENLFGNPDSSKQGIRLIHVAGRHLRPPAYIKFVETDSLGAPIRLNIVIGDTWDNSWDARYARRALLHELAHALMLWGHSRDRNHLLWASGTIVDRPSDDELETVRLWRSLPSGFNYGRYFSRGELDP